MKYQVKFHSGMISSHGILTCEKITIIIIATDSNMIINYAFAAKVKCYGISSLEHYNNGCLMRYKISLISFFQHSKRNFLSLHSHVI